VDRTAVKMPTSHAILMISLGKLENEELFSDYLFIGKENKN
jgi:hypothetical protein